MSANAAPLRIMPLGDSITYQSYSYREKLWDLLEQDEIQIDFVGSQSSGSLPDNNNEGHNGWSTFELNDEIIWWMQAHNPDIVLLHIGTNDVNNAKHAGRDMSGSEAELSGLIDKIYDQSPETKIFVAAIIPSRDCWQKCGQAAMTIDWNSRVRTVVNRKSAEEKLVYLVDMEREAGIDVNTDLGDAVHPNKNGADKMAIVWYNHLTGLSITPDPSPETPEPVIYPEPANVIEMHNIGEHYVSVGDTFEPGLWPVDSENGELLPFNFSKYLITFQFDPRYVEFDSAISNNIFSEQTTFEVQTTANSVTISESSNSIELVSDNFAHVIFRAKGPVESTNIYLINLEYWTTPGHEMSDFGSLDVVFLHDKVHVFGKIDIAPIFTPTPTPTPKTIFSVLGIEGYIHNWTELPAQENLIPDQAWRAGSYIDAWIDIVGWNNMTLRNGTFYIPNNEPQIIDFGYRITGSTVTDVSTSVIFHKDGNYTIAVLSATIMYYTIHCNKAGCWRVYHTAYESFEDMERTPVEIVLFAPPIEIDHIVQNFTYINSSTITVSYNRNIYDRYNVTRDDDFFLKIDRLWHLEQTRKKINYANESLLNVYYTQNISHNRDRLNIADINNTSISASGFYVSTTAKNITSTYQDSDPLQQYLERNFLFFIIILFLCYKFVKRVINR